jgi:hypothetical protein
MFIWKNLLFLYQFTFDLVLREPPNGKEAVETKEELPSTASDVHGFRSWKVKLKPWNVQGRRSTKSCRFPVNNKDKKVSKAVSERLCGF